MTRRLLTLIALTGLGFIGASVNGERPVGGKLAAVGRTHSQLHVGLERVGFELARRRSEEVVEPHARRRPFVDRGGERSPLYPVPADQPIACRDDSRGSRRRLRREPPGRRCGSSSTPRLPPASISLRASALIRHRSSSAIASSRRALEASCSRSTKRPGSRSGRTTWSRSSAPFPPGAATPAARSFTTGS